MVKKQKIETYQQQINQQSNNQTEGYDDNYLQNQSYDRPVNKKNIRNNNDTKNISRQQVQRVSIMIQTQQSISQEQQNKKQLGSNKKLIQKKIDSYIPENQIMYKRSKLNKQSLQFNIKQSNKKIIQQSNQYQLIIQQNKCQQNQRKVCSQQKIINLKLSTKKIMQQKYEQKHINKSNKIKSNKKIKSKNQIQTSKQQSQEFIASGNNKDKIKKIQSNLIKKNKISKKLISKQRVKKINKVPFIPWTKSHHFYYLISIYYMYDMLSIKDKNYLCKAYVLIEKYFNLTIQMNQVKSQNIRDHHNSMKEKYKTIPQIIKRQKIRQKINQEQFSKQSLNFFIIIPEMKKILQFFSLEIEDQSIVQLSDSQIEKFLYRYGQSQANFQKVKNLKYKQVSRKQHLKLLSFLVHHVDEFQLKKIGLIRECALYGFKKDRQRLQYRYQNLVSSYKNVKGIIQGLMKVWNLEQLDIQKEKINLQRFKQKINNIRASILNRDSQLDKFKKKCFTEIPMNISKQLICTLQFNNGLQLKSKQLEYTIYKRKISQIEKIRSLKNKERTNNMQMSKSKTSNKKMSKIQINEAKQEEKQYKFIILYKSKYELTNEQISSINRLGYKQFLCKEEFNKNNNNIFQKLIQKQQKLIENQIIQQEKINYKLRTQYQYQNKKKEVEKQKQVIIQKSQFNYFPIHNLSNNYHLKCEELFCDNLQNKKNIFDQFSFQENRIQQKHGHEQQGQQIQIFNNAYNFEHFGKQDVGSGQKIKEQLKTQNKQIIDDKIKQQILNQNNFIVNDKIKKQQLCYKSIGGYNIGYNHMQDNLYDQKMYYDSKQINKYINQQKQQQQQQLCQERIIKNKTIKIKKEKRIIKNEKCLNQFIKQNQFFQSQIHKQQSNQYLDYQSNKLFHIQFNQYCDQYQKQDFRNEQINNKKQQQFKSYLNKIAKQKDYLFRQNQLQYIQHNQFLMPKNYHQQQILKNDSQEIQNHQQQSLNIEQVSNDYHSSSDSQIEQQIQNISHQHHIKSGHRLQIEGYFGFQVSDKLIQFIQIRFKNKINQYRIMSKLNKYLHPQSQQCNQIKPKHTNKIHILWTYEELLLFFKFYYIYQIQIKKRTKRLNKYIYCLWSDSIKSKTPSQCQMKFNQIKKQFNFNLINIGKYIIQIQLKSLIQLELNKIKNQFNSFVKQQSSDNYNHILNQSKLSIYVKNSIKAIKIHKTQNKQILYQQKYKYLISQTQINKFKIINFIEHNQLIIYDNPLNIYNHHAH